MRVRPFVERFPGGQRLQMGYHLVLQASAGGGGGVLDDHGITLPAKPGHRDMATEHVNVLQRLSAPQAQSPFVQFARCGGLPGGRHAPGVLSHAAELSLIEPDAVRAEPVSGAGPGQHRSVAGRRGRSQQAAYPADLRLDHRTGRCGRIVAP